MLYLHCNMFCILGLVVWRPYGMKFCVEVWQHFIQYCKGYYIIGDVNKPCTKEGVQQSIKKCKKIQKPWKSNADERTVLWWIAINNKMRRTYTIPKGNIKYTLHIHWNSYWTTNWEKILPKNAITIMIKGKKVQPRTDNEGPEGNIGIPLLFF